MSNVIDSRRMSIVARLEVNEGEINQKIKNKGKERCNEKRKRKEKEYIKSQKETRHARFRSPCAPLQSKKVPTAHEYRTPLKVSTTTSQGENEFLLLLLLSFMLGHLVCRTASTCTACTAIPCTFSIEDYAVQLCLEALQKRFAVRWRSILILRIRIPFRSAASG